MDNAEVTALPWNDDTPGREAERLVRRFVCRIGGAPVDGVEEMHATRTLERLEALLAAEDALTARREAVSALLFAAIGAAGDDRGARNRLLRARRELFNLRPLPDAVLEGACAQLSPEQAGEVRALQAGLVERDALAAEVAAAYGEDSAGARARFRELLRDPEFRKGLLVSSRSLHASLDRYAAGTGGTLSGKDEKTERGLLRYYTRMAMKATPFAAFCAVVPGRFTDEGDDAANGDGGMLRLHGDPRAKRSFVRINKLLYGILLDHLKERPGVRRRLVVEPNPTLRTEAGRLVFLSAVQGREVFQRVAANEVLQVITQVFGADPAPTLGDLVDRLTRDPQIEATTEEAEAYLEKLIEIGFLRFHTGIREQDADWDLPFAALLDALDDEHAARSAALLRQVRERTDAYAAAPVERREAVVAEIHAAIEEAFTAMEVKARLRKDMPFYEDATAGADATVPLTPGVLRATDALVDWARLTSRLAWPRAEQATMRHFYDTRYGDTRGIPLLQFYEDFYREHFKAHVEKEQKARAGDRAELDGYDVNNPFKLPFVQALTDARMRLQERIVARWRETPDAAEVSLPLADVEEALAGVEPQPAPCRSVSAFALLVPPREDGGDPAYLLQSGSYTAGYGKYFSRFLYMLPDDFLEEVRAGNQALTDELLAEICGDAQFNANLHPSLLRWEISYPTGESGDAADQLRSSDLFVEPDAEDPHSLALRHGTSGRRVIPVDLGFLNPRMRPPLYQLLSRFTPPVTFAPSVPETPVSPPPPAPKEDGNAADVVAEAPASADGAASPETVEAAAPDAPVSVDGNAVDGGSAEPAAAAEAGDGAAADTSVDTSADAAADGEKADAPPPRPPEITHRPRISIGGRVLLTRRRWLVPGVLLPQRATDETAADFFVRAARWRRDAGLPERCYVRVIPVADPAARKPGDATPAEAVDAQEAAMNVGAEAMPAAEEPEQPEAPKADEGEGAKAEGEAKGPPAKVTAPSRDFYKPQFMDFGNPLLVGLLGKLGAGLKHFNVIVEERLPGPDDLARAGGGRWATEMVVQLDFPEGTANAGAAPARGEEHAALA